MNIRGPIIPVLGVVLIGATAYVLSFAKPSMVVSRSQPVPTSRLATASPPTPIVYYPVSHYAERITNRHFGQLITRSDSQGLPCGAPFTGLHDGDDLEVTTDELATDIPIYAIADGTVRQVSRVNGYGGLLIIQHTLNNQVVTANYGHINLQRTTVKTGDQVTAGQLVSYLGDACSDQTDRERKHLHFAMHQGTTIDIKGYVTTQPELAAWLNPHRTLAQAGAQNPQ